MIKQLSFVKTDSFGIFYVETNHQKRTFRTHSGEVMTIDRLPGGCWPIIYAASNAGDFLYFTYFLSSVLHKWKLNEDGSRSLGLGVSTVEFCDLLASDELDDRSNDARRHIQGKVSDGSIFLDNSANLDSFFAAERIVSAVMLDSDHGLIPDFQMLRGELEGANISISNFMRFSKVPKDYQSKLNFRSKSASLTGTSAHEFLGYLDFNFIEKIERDLISELNKDQDFCFFQFKLGRFTRHLPEVVEVRKLRSDGFNLYPLEWFIDIGLSYHILSNREVRDSWLKRIKASLNTLKHDILEFFSASRAFGKMCCSFGDGGKLISKTITFDGETGTEEIVMPDLYVLTERPLQRFLVVQPPWSSKNHSGRRSRGSFGAAVRLGRWAIVILKGFETISG
jgi:hypothetical protein